MQNFRSVPSVFAAALCDGVSFAQAVRFPIVAAVFSLLFSVSLFGQAVNGTIVGSVTDSTGAVVTNAKVTITEQATNVIAHCEYE